MRKRTDDEWERASNDSHPIEPAAPGRPALADARGSLAAFRDFPRPQDSPGTTAGIRQPRDAGEHSRFNRVSVGIFPILRLPMRHARLSQHAGGFPPTRRGIPDRLPGMGTGSARDDEMRLHCRRVSVPIVAATRRRKGAPQVRSRGRLRCPRDAIFSSFNSLVPSRRPLRDMRENMPNRGARAIHAASAIPGAIEPHLETCGTRRRRAETGERTTRRRSASPRGRIRIRRLLPSLPFPRRNLDAHCGRMPFEDATVSDRVPAQHGVDRMTASRRFALRGARPGAQSVPRPVHLWSASR